MQEKNKGFTLIEIMIVVVIIGALFAIGYQSYQSYVKKTKRIEAQAALVKIAGELQRYKAINHTFKPNGIALTLSDLGYSVDSNGQYSFPAGQVTTYTFSLNAVTQNSWRLSARPRNGQLGDGYLGLDQNGMRCWNSSDIMWCQPNSATSWDKQSQ